MSPAQELFFAKQDVLQAQRRIRWIKAGIKRHWGDTSRLSGTLRDAEDRLAAAEARLKALEATPTA